MQNFSNEEILAPSCRIARLGTGLKRFWSFIFLFKQVFQRKFLRLEGGGIEVPKPYSCVRPCCLCFHSLITSQQISIQEGVDKLRLKCAIWLTIKNWKLKKRINLIVIDEKITGSCSGIESCERQAIHE